MRGLILAAALTAVAPAATTGAQTTPESFEFQLGSLVVDGLIDVRIGVQRVQQIAATSPGGRVTPASPEMTSLRDVVSRLSALERRWSLMPAPDDNMRSIVTVNRQLYSALHASWSGLLMELDTDRNARMDVRRWLNNGALEALGMVAETAIEAITGSEGGSRRLTPAERATLVTRIKRSLSGPPGIPPTQSMIPDIGSGALELLTEDPPSKPRVSPH